ncbi:L-Aspartase-like [Moorella glycerini]|uniref:Aspartate ammonia-lyase n=1 Tax=Neomoorella stamsii TaxID=1266720 RepID=A0A9X7P6J0_9FIRM|nr:MULTISPECIES: aspartate ammonia-lyase [Moorella]PRR73434.1 Aspartate ammonia-lyase [Moorella stamsii]CEP69203.1 L-Aspartase-like [Moorella glycerini]
MLAEKISFSRVEEDSLGQKTIIDNAYYGIHSLRAKENFTVSGYKLHPELIKALAIVKKAAALANMKAGTLERSKALAIARAADEIINGKWHEYFIGEAIQGGAGTGINMNANEVIANRALEILGYRPGTYDKLNPVDDVNYGQSTNDVIPTAIRIAAIRLLQRYVEANLLLVRTLREKAEEYKDAIKLGRTHLQDAVPLKIGDELKAWAEAIRRDARRGEMAINLLVEVNLGGTAIGTGLNAHPHYREIVIEELRAASGIPQLRRAADLIDATQNLDVMVEVAGLLRAGAVTLTKIANDLRLLASGPMAGLAEIELPHLAAGSSIMAGKVNPIIPEVVNQVCFKVFGNDLTISLAAAAGQLELNVMQPVLAFALFESLGMLSEAINSLALKAIKGMKFRLERCENYVNSALSLVTPLVPYIGYQAATRVAKQALASGKSIIDIVRELKLLPEGQARELLDPRHMLAN